MSTFMLDSGAFSAWNRGKVIDLDYYIEFIKANAEHLDYYVALDVIPGSFGVVPTPAEVEASAAKSWENFLYMESHGLTPIPVFHMGEQFKWLRRMVEHGCPYIGISPANDRTTDKKRVWLDRVFNEICDAEGMPVVKTHAFGVTALDLLTRYPWYSADSTTWIMLAARGKIMVPDQRNGEWVWDEPPTIYYVSEPYGEGEVLARNLKDSQWRHSPSQMQRVLTWLEQAGGYTLADMDSYIKRTIVCCYFFQEFQRQFKPKPFKRTKNTFFTDV